MLIKAIQMTGERAKLVNQTFRLQARGISPTPPCTPGKDTARIFQRRLIRFDNLSGEKKETENSQITLESLCRGSE